MLPLDLIEAVVFLCIKHRGSVSSWGRTPAHNKAVGGVEGSLHIIWLGCDVVLDDNQKNVDFEKDARILGLSALWEASHYHLQPGGK